MATVNNLIFYDTTDPLAIASSAIFKHRYGILAADTWKNLTGIVTGTIDTYIGTLGATAFDGIYVLNAHSGGAVTGCLDTLQLYALLAKLKAGSAGSIVGAVYEDATTHTTTTIGLAGSTWTTNEHAGRFVKTVAGTGTAQLARIVSNTATVLTISGVFTTEPDATTHFEIWEDIGIYALGNTIGGYAGPLLAWQTIYPELEDTAIPNIIHYLADPKYPYMTGTAISVTADTLKNTGVFTGLDLEGYVVAIIDSTVGKYQKAIVESNDANDLTLTANWTFTPTGTIVYNLFPEDVEVLYDVYCKLFIVTKMYDISNAVMWNMWKSVLGTRGAAEVLKFPELPPVVDQDVLDRIVEEGKIMAEYFLVDVSR